MKQCTWCGTEHPDEATVCSLDQQPLKFVATPASTPEPVSSPPSNGWPQQVVIPAAAWLIVNFLLISQLTFGASFLFGLLTASWAAIDCARLQSKGSRTLGITFTPFVAFAVVAFLLWGFGFIWYLVMRHRVMTAPNDSPSEKTTKEPPETWSCQNCGEANPMNFDSCWNCRSKGNVTRIIPEQAETPPQPFPRGGNPWE